jgi:hypothetical protein
MDANRSAKKNEKQLLIFFEFSMRAAAVIFKINKFDITSKTRGKPTPRSILQRSSGFRALSNSSR